MPETPESIKAELKALAHKLGCQLFGVGAVPELEPNSEHFLQWTRSGAHGQMHWLERSNERRLYPQAVFPGARSVIVVGLNYQGTPKKSPQGLSLARYAQGKDYHNVLMKKLKSLCAALSAHGADNKPYVDTGPVMEKAFAERAGLGWQGKNTLLVAPQFGSWLFLGIIFTTLKLPPDAPAKKHCGTCSACVQACPTGALDGTGVLDARRCLSYLTIEYKGALPPWAMAAIGGCVAGCDRCQKACPFGQKCPPSNEPAFAPRAPLPDAAEIFEWSEADFDWHFEGSGVRRVGLDTFKRNVAAALGNTGDTDALPALDFLEKSTHNEAVRAAASWAKNEILSRAARS